MGGGPPPTLSLQSGVGECVGTAPVCVMLGAAWCKQGGPQPGSSTRQLATTSACWWGNSHIPITRFLPYSVEFCVSYVYSSLYAYFR